MAPTRRDVVRTEVRARGGTTAVPPIAAPIAFLLVAVTVVATVVAVLTMGLPRATAPAAAVSQVGGGPAAVVAATDTAVAPGTAATSGAFTLAELAAGEVSVTRFAAFWEAELDRIAAAPCGGAVAPGSTVVTLSVGATPPSHLGPEFTDYGPLLTEARAAASARCS